MRPGSVLGCIGLVCVFSIRIELSLLGAHRCQSISKVSVLFCFVLLSALSRCVLSSISVLFLSPGLFSCSLFSLLFVCCCHTQTKERRCRPLLHLPLLRWRKAQTIPSTAAARSLQGRRPAQSTQSRQATCVVIAAPLTLAKYVSAQCLREKEAF